MDAVAEIKSRLEITEVVGWYVPLKKAGRNLKGLCPFHSEKSPSFMVNPEKQIAYCFGCHRGGDLFKFIMEVEGMDFVESLKFLAEKANVVLEAQPTGASKTLKDRMAEIQKAAAEYYSAQLQGAAGAHAREYVRSRALTAETVQLFHIGYAPSGWDHLSVHLKQLGFLEDELIQAGVSIARDQKRDGVYDRFRDRLMFPLIDSQHRVVGFTGRALQPGAEPKYLNSPETPLFRKSEFLYGFGLGKERIKQENRVLLMEGQMDVVTAHQHGFTFAVATSGTALTPEHLKLIQRFTPNVVMAFDTDEAGVHATTRAIELAIRSEMNIGILDLPHGKDPDEALKTHPEEFVAALAQPLSWMDFYFTRVYEGANLEDIGTKKRIAQELLTLILQCPNAVEQEAYLQRLSERLHVSEKALATQMSTIDTPKWEEALTLERRRWTREEYLLGLLFNYPVSTLPILATLPQIIMDHSPYHALYTALTPHYNDASAILAQWDSFLAACDFERQQYLKVVTLVVGEQYHEFEAESIEREVHLLVRQLKQDFLKSQLKALTVKIRTSEEQKNHVELDQLLQYQQRLLHTFK